jgi:hypothetical protein
MKPQPPKRQKNADEESVSSFEKAFPQEATQ